MKSYSIEPYNRFLQISLSIIKHEIRPANKVTFFSEVDLSEVEAIRAAALEQGQKKPSYTTFVAKAVALALLEFPYANRRVYRRVWLPFSKPRMQKFNQIDLSVAVERWLPDAEMVAFVDILREADKLSLDEITVRLRELATSDTETNQQWREFSTLVQRFPSWLAGLAIRLPLYSPDLWVKYRGGAVVITSPAKYGVDVVSANWWAPIGVSFGMVRKRPVVCDDQLAAHPTFTLTLNFDARVMAGAQGARFCKGIIDNLEQAQTKMADYINTEQA